MCFTVYAFCGKVRDPNLEELDGDSVRVAIGLPYRVEKKYA